MKKVVNQVTRSQGHELLNRLEAAGLTKQLAQRVIDLPSEKLGEQIVRLIELDGYFSPIDPKEAQQVMGDNFIGFDVAQEYFGLELESLDQGEVNDLKAIPFSSTLLKSLRRSHILIFVPGMAIYDFPHQRSDWSTSSVKLEIGRWGHQAYLNESVCYSWCLVQKGQLPESSNKPVEEHVTLLPPCAEVPRAQVLAYTTLSYYFKTGKVLFESGIRTGSIYTNRQEVCMRANSINCEGRLTLDLSLGSNDKGSQLGIAAMYRH